MRRQLATELGPHGVRVVTLRTGGVPESMPHGVNGREAIVEGIEKQTLLGRAATLEDVGNVAAFVASDRARTMTAATATSAAARCWTSDYPASRRGVHIDRGLERRRSSNAAPSTVERRLQQLAIRWPDVDLLPPAVPANSSDDLNPGALEFFACE